MHATNPGWNVAWLLAQQVVGQAIDEGSAVPFEITITTNETEKTLTIQDTVSPALFLLLLSLLFCEEKKKE